MEEIGSTCQLGDADVLTAAMADEESRCDEPRHLARRQRR